MKIQKDEKEFANKENVEKTNGTEVKQEIKEEVKLEENKEKVAGYDKNKGEKAIKKDKGMEI